MIGRIAVSAFVITRDEERNIADCLDTLKWADELVVVDSGSTDATVEIRTVLSIEDGGTYEASAYVDVPPGGELFVEYPLVRYEELSAAEEEAVRRGNAEFETYVNGERRQV